MTYFPLTPIKTSRIYVLVHMYVAGCVYHLIIALIFLVKNQRHCLVFIVIEVFLTTISTDLKDMFYADTILL